MIFRNILKGLSKDRGSEKDKDKECNILQKALTTSKTKTQLKTNIKTKTTKPHKNSFETAPSISHAQNTNQTNQYKM